MLKNKYPALWISMALLVLIGCFLIAKRPVSVEAVYLGVKDYGKEGVNKDNKESFLYRFEVKGKEKIYSMDNGTRDAAGNYDYPIQNILKEGYSYRITVKKDRVTAAEEIRKESLPFEPVVKGTPGERTVRNFLKTALMPAGTTLYIYGGGWDWQDEGASLSTRSLGVSPDWVRFFEENDAGYTFKEKDGDKANTDPEHSYYPYGGYNEYYYAGLDCTGYVGWTLYNTFETEDVKAGFVGGSTGMAQKLSERGWGEWTQDIKAPDGKNGYEMKPGDIMSINGHVWIALGTCKDGSVVILHSTPSMSVNGQPGGGVQISAVGTDETCEAYRLADAYSSKYYPRWRERYPVYLCSPDRYFTFEGGKAGRFSWNTDASSAGLSDPDGLRDLPVEEVLKLLFEE